MQTRRLGKTELMVSCIGLGGLGILSKYHNDYDTTSTIINLAIDNGVNFIDTARWYEDSEDRIGEVMKYRRKECYLATKTLKRSAQKAAEEIDISLECLKTDKIDLYQIHHIQWENELEEILASDGALKALKDAQKEGKIDYIGVTGHRPEIIRKAIETGEFDVIQIPYNPMDMQLFKEIIPIANKMDLGIIVMKALCGGLLSEVSDVTLALRFLLSHNISTVILGMSTTEHVLLDTKIGQEFTPLSIEEKERLFENAERLGKDFCRQCGYCLPVCSSKLQIPDIFRFEKYLTIYKTGHWAKKQYQALEVKVDACTECGECETICPYQLSIRKMLIPAHKELIADVTSREIAYHGGESFFSPGRRS
ncbi:MAG: aldo/keto reductase [bacterium]|nr:aldo/keto reductase [bacterium]